MALISIDMNPPRRQLRQFGLVFFPAFMGLLGWILTRATGSITAGIVCWSLAPLVFLLGAFAPAAVRPFWIVSMCVSFPIGFVISHVVIALVYYVVLTPAGLLLRLFKGDPLKRAWDPAVESYWIKRPPEATVERYFRQF